MQRHAALGLGDFQFLDGGKVTVGQDGSGGRPQVLGWLQLGQ